MLEMWTKYFKGDLGIALSDNLGTEKFVRDFDKAMAKEFDGVRHDSGEPHAWGEAMIEMYKAHKIDPHTKTLLFSDSLDYIRACELQEYFSRHINVAFGIGTNITNNIPGHTALNMVYKLVSANGRPVCKLSNDMGKSMCEDEGFVKALKNAINGVY
jgi:nicotinate phosphoribosyltransferase